MDTLASFRSRSEALKFNNALNRQRIAGIVINTPSSLKIGCGLSVVFDSSLKNQVGNIVKQLNLQSFVGFYMR